MKTELDRTPEAIRELERDWVARVGAIADTRERLGLDSALKQFELCIIISAVTYMLRQHLTTAKAIRHINKLIDEFAEPLPDGAEHRARMRKDAAMARFFSDDPDSPDDHS